MSEILVCYNSYNGSTLTYCEWIANVLKADIISLNDIKKKKLTQYNQIIFAGAIRLNEITGLKKLRKMGANPNIILAVGYSRVTSNHVRYLAKKNDIVKGSKFFCVKGLFDSNMLKSKKERSLMDSVGKELFSLKNRDDNQEYLLNIIKYPCDWLNPENLKPIIQQVSPDKVDSLSNIEYTQIYNNIFVDTRLADKVIDNDSPNQSV